MWRRFWRPWPETFSLVVLWDWLGTVSIRYVAEESLWAVPLAVALTGFWWVAAKQAQRPGLLAPALLGAAVGTAIGLSWL